VEVAETLAPIIEIYVLVIGCVPIIILGVILVHTAGSTFKLRKEEKKKR
jgi:hypothetical protein